MTYLMLRMISDLRKDIIFDSATEAKEKIQTGEGFDAFAKRVGSLTDISDSSWTIAMGAER